MGSGAGVDMGSSAGGDSDSGSGVEAIEVLREVGSVEEEDTKVHLGCWKVQGSLRSSLGGFGNRVMVVSGIATWPMVEVRFAGAKVGLEAFW